MFFEKWISGAPFFTAFPNDTDLVPANFDTWLAADMMFLDIPEATIIRTYPFTDAFTGTNNDPWDSDKWGVSTG
jgi:hypothetical protein